MCENYLEHYHVLVFQGCVAYIFSIIETMFQNRDLVKFIFLRLRVRNIKLIHIKNLFEGQTFEILLVKIIEFEII